MKYLLFYWVFTTGAQGVSTNIDTVQFESFHDCSIAGEAIVTHINGLYINYVCVARNVEKRKVKRRK